jgi:hypothetical protein
VLQAQHCCFEDSGNGYADPWYCAAVVVVVMAVVVAVVAVVVVIPFWSAFGKDNWNCMRITRYVVTAPTICKIIHCGLV